MIKDDLNWNSIDEKIRELKYPLVFIFSIIKNQNKISDNDLTLIIRFFFKNQINLTINYPLFVMTNLLDDKFVMSKKVVSDYYMFLLKKLIIFRIINRVKNYFKADILLNKNFTEQLLTIYNLLSIFKANFDSSITGLSGATKFISQLRLKNNPVIYQEIKNRVNTTIDLFGLDFFKNFNIKLIKSEIFHELNPEAKIKYLLYYYLKVDKVLRKILNIFETFKIYDDKIKQIINPKPIKINFDCIYSENDSDDILLLMQY